ncbi:methyl-accepting chemotaxis protein [Paenibacillus barcinonensis]|uniref:Methyl-accepting chemotaxis protein n=1 Tax=Paenibacillus barcinonensis TaxID=198119 RepID=A0A2V4VMH7_PAEBA|nr:methyl-accepting chemotaxis protein [Paenibacillus barcinonensis]PYE47361.1 methyl-accepting chemotaxis protein [Paenibacillus barcinonensis]QKS58252.1 methyl-accepting chemotaxis protein [Paenibacillus barcinonensis]
MNHIQHHETGKEGKETKLSPGKNKKKSKKKAFVWSIRYKLLLSFLCVLILPSLAVSFVTLTISEDTVQEQLSDSAMQSVTTVNKIVESHVNSKIFDINFFSDSLDPALVKGEEDSTELQKKFVQYLGLHPDVVNIFVGSTEGVMVRGKPTASSLRGEAFDPREREWYKLAMNKPGTVAVSPVTKNTEGLPVVFISKTLKDQSAVIGLSLDLTDLRDQAQAKVGSEGYVIIEDGNQNYVVSPVKEVGTKDTSGVMNQMYESKEGQFEYIFEGRPKMMIFTTNEATGWKIAGTMFKSEVTDASKEIRLATLIVLLASVLLATLYIFWFTGSMIRPIKRLQENARAVSKGDLTVKMDSRRKDEVGELAKYFERMVDNLRMMILGVQETAEQVSASSQELSASADQTTKAIEHSTVAMQELAEGAEQQVSSVKEGSEEMERMADDVRLMSERVQSITTSMRDTSGAAFSGNEAAGQAVEQMNIIQETVQQLGQVVHNLHDRSIEIGSMVDVIASISKQTNLLALNASIEAARAGDAGRGFAVVAGEVRKLAEESGSSAAQIGELVHNIRRDMDAALTAMNTTQSRVDEGLQAVNTSGQSFAQIREAVEDAVHTLDELSATTKQLEIGASHVVQTMTDISNVTQESAASTESVSASSQEQLASVEEIASSSAHLNSMAEQLQGLLGMFKMNDDKAKDSGKS